MNATASNLLRFLVATAAIIVMAPGLNFLVDPLQLFRPARLFAAMYSPDTRMQDAGLIRSQEFDTVLMGIARRAFPAERRRPDHWRTIAETFNDGLEFARAGLRAGGGNGASPEPGDLADGTSIFRPISIAATPRA